MRSFLTLCTLWSILSPGKHNCIRIHNTKHSNLRNKLIILVASNWLCMNIPKHVRQQYYCPFDPAIWMWYYVIHLWNLFQSENYLNPTDTRHWWQLSMFLADNHNQRCKLLAHSTISTYHKPSIGYIIIIVIHKSSILANIEWIDGIAYNRYTDHVPTGDHIVLRWVCLHC